MIKEYWKNRGADYNRSWEPKLQQELSRKEMAFVNRYFKIAGGSKILDVGFGTGRVIKQYLFDNRSVEIYGLDYSPKMLKYCQNEFKKKPRVKKLINCDISKEKIPFNFKFNFISAIRILKYNQNWCNILKKLTESLKGNGIIVFTMPNAFSISTLIKDPVSHTTPEEIRQICQHLNLEILEMTSFNKIPNSLYFLSNSSFYVKLILLMENLLTAGFGNIFLGKCLFIAARKR